MKPLVLDIMRVRRWIKVNQREARRAVSNDTMDIARNCILRERASLKMASRVYVSLFREQSWVLNDSVSRYRFGMTK